MIRVAIRPLATLIALTMLTVLISTGCAPEQHLDRWDGMRVGMTKSQVRALLGEPRNSGMLSVDEAAGEIAPVDREWWSYGVTGLIGMRAAMDGTRAGPQSDAHIVWFDEAGRLVRWWEPLE